MREIGGYFELERFGGEEYHAGALALNTARSCLALWVRQSGCTTMYLPDYLCPSVAQCLAREGVCIKTYPVGDDLLPRAEIVPGAHEAVYVVNYYGQLSNEVLRSLREAYRRIVVDNVQTFFQMPLPGVPTLYSCRKWFGVPDGAYLYADGVRAQDVPAGSAAGRFEHLLGRFEETASAWYAAYRASEETLDAQDVLKMSELSHNLLRAVDYGRARSRRTRNFALLHEALKEKNRLHLTVPDGPFAYPLAVDGADGRAVRAQLAERKIYVPTLWPGLTGEAARRSEAILPLPVDQRCGDEEMQRILCCLDEVL